MSMNLWKLEHLSSRTLNLLGSIIRGGDVRIVLSKRATEPLTVVLESNTIILDPNRCGLYDLLLGAGLLQHRAMRKKGPDEAERKDRWLTLKVRNRWAVAMQEELRRKYPGIVQLQGRYRPGAKLDGMCMVASKVKWDPLPPVPRKTPSGTTGKGPAIPRPYPRIGEPGSIDGLEMTGVPEIEITGAEDDYAWLIEALTNDALPLRTIAGLEELPVLRVPFRLSLANASPTAESFEELLAAPENKETIESLMKCYRRKSEVRQERRHLGQRTRSGVTLDATRLVDAVIASRTGGEPRLFRKRGSTIEPVFDPSEHLVVISFDINDLRPPKGYYDDDMRASVKRFLVCCITTYERLGVDCIVQGFADQLMTLPDGRNVCLHMAITLKTIEEPFDSTFWYRIEFLCQNPPKFPGEPTCFHPLSQRDMVEAFDQAEKGSSHSYRAILWWARRAMNRDFPEYDTADFLMRTADVIDGEMENLGRRLEGTLDTLASFLPRKLRDHGHPGRYLQEIQMP